MGGGDNGDRVNYFRLMIRQLAAFISHFGGPSRYRHDLPTGILDILGQCVTGDTVLKRRRRRRRRGKNGEWIEEEYFENVRIDEIKEGDEILTLDETTGGLVISQIKALMDMGKKNHLQTHHCRWKNIRTTAEHPYLVRLPNENGQTFDLDFAFIDEVGVSHSPDQPLFGVGTFLINDTIEINRDLHDVLTGALSFYNKDVRNPGRFEFKFNAIKQKNVQFFRRIIKILKNTIGTSGISLRINRSFMKNYPITISGKDIWLDFRGLPKILDGRLQFWQIILMNRQQQKVTFMT